MKSGKKTLLLVGIPLGVGLIAALLILIIIPKLTAPTPKVPNPAAGQHGMMVPIDTKVVNLAPGGDYKYAKVGVTIELRPDTADYYTMLPAAQEPLVVLKVKDMANMLPLLDDAVATVVSAKTSTELLSDTGRAQLRAEILDAVRAVLDGESATASGAPSAGPSTAPAESTAPAADASEVLDIYFTDLVMQ